MDVYRIARAISAAIALATVTPAYGLTLEEALRLATENSPTVLRAREELRVVKSLRVGAAVHLPANPIVSSTLGHRFDVSASVPASRGFEYALRLEQMFEVAGQRSARLTENDRAVRLAERGVAAAQIAARARAKLAYVHASIADNKLRAAQRRESTGQLLYDSAVARLKVGASNEVELQLARVEKARATASRIDAEISSRQLLGELRLLIGSDVDAQLTVSLATAPAPREAQLSQLVALAKTHRIELQQLADEDERLRAAESVAKREVAPNPSLAVDFASQQPGQYYVGGAIAVPIPVARRQQGQRALLAAERARIRSERAIVEREIVAEVDRALISVRDRARELAQWQQEALPAAEQSLELVTIGWRAGKFDLFRVVHASREVGDVQHGQLDALAQYWEAAVELERSTGGL